MSKIGLSRPAAILLGLSVALPATAASAQPGADALSPQTSIKLTRVIAALPADKPWLSLKQDSWCIQHTLAKTWTYGRQPQELSLFSDGFKNELQRSGYKVVTPADDLFNQDTGAADFEVAAVITDEFIEGCLSPGGPFDAEKDSVRGTSSMKVDWQVYSPIQKQIVARISTSGSAKLDRSIVGGVARLINESFASNARDLASRPDFRSAVTGTKAPAPGDLVASRQQSKIALSGSLKAIKRPISDTVGSVVTILTGTGSGSGDLVSNDGYMLTNAHVVGDEKQVRVRWSDGIETVGEVVRVVKTRDVALVKTNPRDREPLAIKRGAVTPGQRVYAIGSPLGKEFQNTVSSGIISATRIIEGLRYIQSDVAITHGSSGGALLDENGAMIGITVSTVEPGGAPVGINFFIPIGDAMDFLNLDPQ